MSSNRSSSKGQSCFNSGDYVCAFREWSKSAAEGNARAQDGLGVLYFSGRGVPRDLDNAIFWFEKAARQGDKHAKAHLREARASKQKVDDKLREVREQLARELAAEDLPPLDWECFVKAAVDVFIPSCGSDDSTLDCALDLVRLIPHSQIIRLGRVIATSIKYGKKLYDLSEYIGAVQEYDACVLNKRGSFSHVPLLNSDRQAFVLQKE